MGKSSGDGNAQTNRKFGGNRTPDFAGLRSEAEKNKEQNNSQQTELLPAGKQQPEVFAKEILNLLKRRAIV
jgi:hypothetical protein